jgi:hypothetical protein
MIKLNAPGWQQLYENANGRTVFGQVGVRDPEYPCVGFDAKGYSGNGDCESDGHYMCMKCSKLSKEADRFTENYKIPWV